LFQGETACTRTVIDDFNLITFETQRILKTQSYSRFVFDNENPCHTRDLH
jgi:hypothetical protein